MKPLRIKEDHELTSKEALLFLNARRIAKEVLTSMEIRVNRFLRDNPKAQEMEQVEYTTFMGTICTNIVGYMLISMKNGVDRYFDSCDVTLQDLYEEIFEGVRLALVQNQKPVIPARPDNDNPFASVRPPKC